MALLLVGLDPSELLELNMWAYTTTGDLTDFKFWFNLCWQHATRNLCKGHNQRSLSAKQEGTPRIAVTRPRDATGWRS